jgi:hypothetical protein
MSSVQSPPMTVITVPPSTTTTQATTTTTTATTVPRTATTVVGETPLPVGAGDTPEDGLVLLVFLAIALLAALVVGAMWLIRRRRGSGAPTTRHQGTVAGNAALVDRIREVAERSRQGSEVPDAIAIGDISIADLYPWLEAGDDLTLVVDLTTAEALQTVGVTSLAQLADLDDERAEVLSNAGIEIDAASVIAAQDILGRRADEQGN